MPYEYDECDGECEDDGYEENGYVDDDGEYHEGYDENRDFGNGDDDVDYDFADPGGNSALRAATKDNPRNLPCPTCERPNQLTPKDRALGYQCDHCANEAERGF